MATQNNFVVRDGQASLISRRAYDIDGARADAPFVPEIGEKGDAAWSGSGSASMIALMKALCDRVGAVMDNTGVWIHPGSIPLVGATYDSGGNPLTLRRSTGAVTWVQTSTYDESGNVLTRTVWERQ